MPERKIIKCPFCEHEDIITLYTPKMMVTKYERAGSNRKAVNFFKDEEYKIISERCPNCGKSKKEIEKVLKRGKEPSNADIVKRLREAGLDPTKLK